MGPTSLETKGRRVVYLVGDSPVPSWGTGIIYGHVRFLRDMGVDALVLHEQRPFRLAWMPTEVPVSYLEPDGFRPAPDDLVVVPEVRVKAAVELGLPGRKFVFNQGSFYILHGLPEAFTYPELGFEGSITILPHLVPILSRHFGVDPLLVPPFISPYFFQPPEEGQGRRRRILLASKPEYGAAGYLDADIFRKIVGRAIEKERWAEGWELVELKGLKHREVAELMQSSAFLVNLNTLEAFNSTVPEAMAAGCIAICYEAFGGQDFLEPGQNALVFPNNHIYPLVDATLDAMREQWAGTDSRLANLRRGGYETALRFSEERAREALKQVFEPLLHG